MDFEASEEERKKVQMAVLSIFFESNFSPLPMVGFMVCLAFSSPLFRMQTNYVLTQGDSNYNWNHLKEEKKKVKVSN